MSTAVQEYKQIDLFRNTLPTRPYATDELGPMWRMDVLEAVKRRYISPNSQFDLRWLVYDVDRPTASFDWYDLNCPPPNWIAMNRENGHAHLGYGLERPVWQQFGPDSKAFRYAASVDVALTKKLAADPSYGKLIAKNPLRPDAWEVLVYQPVSYDLPWLADYLDLEPYQDRRRRLPDVGLGRNCTLFDYLRGWAYRNIRREWLSYDMWLYSVNVVGKSYNVEEFRTPLGEREVFATSKSIAKWTWAHMSRRGFDEWSEARRRKSLAVRRDRADETAEKIRAAASENPSLSNRKLAALLGVSLDTVNRARRPTI